MTTLSRFFEARWIRGRNSDMGSLYAGEFVCIVRTCISEKSVGFNKMMFLLSFIPRSNPGLLDRMSAREFCFSGRWRIVKWKSCRSDSHLACRRFSFWGFWK
jgi:hypothetical protein